MNKWGATKEEVPKVVEHSFEKYLENEASDGQNAKLLKAMRPFLWSAYLAGIEKGLALMVE